MNPSSFPEVTAAGLALIARLVEEHSLMAWCSMPDTKPGMRAYQATHNGICAMVVEYNGPDGIGCAGTVVGCAGTVVDSCAGLIVFLPAEVAGKLYRDISKARN